MVTTNFEKSFGEALVDMLTLFLCPFTLDKAWTSTVWKSRISTALVVLTMPDTLSRVTQYYYLF